MEGQIADTAAHDAAETEKRAPSAEDIRKMVCDCYGNMGLSPVPSCRGPEDISFDFCWGARVFIPDNTPRGAYRVRILDDNDGRVVYDDTTGRSSWIQTTEHYYKPFRIQILDPASKAVLMDHGMDLKDRLVLVSFPVETVGDTLAWFPSVVEFKRVHKCKMMVAMAPHMRKLLEPANPEILFIEREEMRNMHPYAFYQMGVNYDGATGVQPYDWRQAPLHWVGANLLGVDAHRIQDTPPAIDVNVGVKRPEEPYVCISSMASGGCKLWLNPNGWEEVVEFLRKSGYRVLDIDGKRMIGRGFITHRIPANAEDWTGQGEGQSLADRAGLIAGADFFIGIGSGLSWLAWACGKPVVLISGFSLPWCEFYTPYRVCNTYACHGCFNDVREKFDQYDCYWCPKHANTPAQLICSTSITSTMVINAIRRMPEFQARMRQAQAGKESAPSPGEGPVQIRDGAVCAVSSAKDAAGASETAAPSGTVTFRPGEAGAKEAMAALQRQLESMASAVETKAQSVEKGE